MGMVMAPSNEDWGWFLSSWYGEAIKGIEHQRIGQALFNGLHTVRPDIANMVRSGNFDPFCRDDKIPAFIQEIFRLWVDNPIKSQA
jgi:hypothetical protein